MPSHSRLLQLPVAFATCQGVLVLVYWANHSTPHCSRSAFRLCWEVALQGWEWMNEELGVWSSIPELRGKPVPLTSMLLSFPAWTGALIKKTRVTLNTPCVGRKLFKFPGFAVPLEVSSSTNTGECGGFLLPLTVLFPSWLGEWSAHPPVSCVSVPALGAVCAKTGYSVCTHHAQPTYHPCE